VTRALVCALAALALLATSEAALAAYPGHNGRIAFVSNRDAAGTANLEIYSMNPDGTDVRRLTDHPRPDEEPSWSPDGSHIAFSGTRDDQYGLYVMDADGSDVRRLSEGRFFFPTGSPSWSPDGKQVVFQGNTGVTANDLYVVNADGTGQRKLTDTPDVREFTPAWSPDGSRIAFSQLVPPCTTVVCNFEIFTINLDGSGKTRLTHDSDQDTDPDWSPDGTKVAYGSLDGVTEVRVVSAAGTDDHGFAPPALGYTPAWSPDGRQIAWSASGNEINVMNADGSEQRNVSNSAAFDVQPDWQPVNRAPDCAGVSASPAELGPPNHKLAPVRLSGASDPDGDLVTLEVTAVTQDEPVAGAPDAERSTPPGELLLRAERGGSGDGRVYRVAFVARDGLGGACAGTATVRVRKGSAAPVDSAPPSYDSLGS
jgi:TolB protein